MRVHFEVGGDQTQTLHQTEELLRVVLEPQGAAPQVEPEQEDHGLLLEALSEKRTETHLVTSVLSLLLFGHHSVQVDDLGTLVDERVQHGDHRVPVALVAFLVLVGLNGEHLVVVLVIGFLQFQHSETGALRFRSVDDLPSTVVAVHVADTVVLLLLGGVASGLVDHQRGLQVVAVEVEHGGGTG